MACRFTLRCVRDMIRTHSLSTHILQLQREERLHLCFVYFSYSTNGCSDFLVSCCFHWNKHFLCSFNSIQYQMSPNWCFIHYYNKWGFILMVNFQQTNLYDIRYWFEKNILINLLLDSQYSSYGEKYTLFIIFKATTSNNSSGLFLNCFHLFI